METVTLKNGKKMPLLGFGTFKLTGAECTKSVELALETGYRLFDTAQVYANQEDVGKALKKASRNSLFITSKIWITEFAPEKVSSAIDRILKELAVDYLDLLLLHWPDPKIEIKYTLEKLLEAKEKGHIHTIGISNFVLHHLTPEVLHDYSVEVNQLEYHPFLQQQAVVDFCEQHTIHVQAYSSLTRGNVCGNPILELIAKKHNKTVPQIALRWGIQKGRSVIPKSGNPERIKANFECFDFQLSPEEMKQIDTLERNQRIVHPFCADFEAPLIHEKHSLV